MAVPGALREERLRVGSTRLHLEHLYLGRSLPFFIRALAVASARGGRDHNLKNAVSFTETGLYPVTTLEFFSEERPKGRIRLIRLQEYLTASLLNRETGSNQKKSLAFAMSDWLWSIELQQKQGVRRLTLA